MAEIENTTKLPINTECKQKDLQELKSTTKNVNQFGLEEFGLRSKTICFFLML